MTFPLTPVESWTTRRLEGLSLSSSEDLGKPLHLESRKKLEEAQERALRHLIRGAVKDTLFYRERLQGLEEAPLKELPLTLPSDLQEREFAFLGTSQSRIERRVSLSSSGTRSPSKRLGFTREELRKTEDFFLYGMSTFTPPRSVVGIFMEGSRPWSIGDLLKRALERMDCTPRIFGLVEDPLRAAAWMEKVRPRVVVGLPSHMAFLAGETLWTPETVLLSADIAPRALRKRIEKKWHCKVYNHYGLTESGWGCAVECAARGGCHVRELDLLLEILDSRGEKVPEGSWGEVVLTTLGRPSFPLIRYRTGDRGRFLSGTCSCGSVLKRLEVSGRLPLKGAEGIPLHLEEVENILWDFDAIRDFSLLLRHEGSLPAELVAVLGISEKAGLPLETIEKALRCVPGMPPRILLEKSPELFLQHSGIKRDWNN
ncbi:MAG TPA: phenylacetate--CoA ligase family protein [Synergistaceae bacterium]|nr:phenylacetate--CoA ligase family protein [Synergistaceae bacterium]